MKLQPSAAAVLAVLATSAHATIPSGFSSNAPETTWVTNFDGSDTRGNYGTISFNDWGYRGPTGVTAADFQVGSGFDASRVGQVQSVVTKSPDWLTPDARSSATVNGENYTSADFGNVTYPTSTPLPNANMDGGVNFYHWGYTTPAGSTFGNMQIDKAGNYHIAKQDMNFGFYDNFEYNNGSSIENVDSGINFQPYTVSDAQGWCGSTMVSNPYGVEQMAGQVTFDFAIDVYYSDGGPGDFFQTELIPGFVMRSFGDYEVSITNVNGDDQFFTGSAVGNNFNPVTGELDANFENQVSFLGAGIIPDGVWVLGEGTPDVQIVAEGTVGATWHNNAFAGKAFLLRADAERTLEWINPEGHSDYVSTSVVPVPAAVWLFATGFVSLIGIARRKSAV